MPKPSPLVGRKAELTVIEQALNAVCDDGEARSLGLRGEAGIGKSRLLREVRSVADRRGARVVSGRASELERDLPFALLTDALGALDDGGVLASAPGSGERHVAARAVRSLLERAATERPLVVVLDDVHWADPASADVVALLVARPPRAPVLLALAMRPGQAEALESVVASSVRAGDADLVELAPLGREAVEALLPDAPRAVADRLYAESGGNPFFLEELVRSSSGGAAAATGVELAGLPSLVRAALASEVASLSESARLLLEAAAVAGDPFDTDLAAVAAELDEAAVLGPLDELLDAELVRPTDRPRRFRFRHPVVRRAVYEDTPVGWRLAAHTRLADSLAARGARAAERAHHVERAAVAGDAEAIDLLVAAAGEVRLGAPATAATWLAAALRLLPAGAGVRRLELLGAQAGALTMAGRPDEARVVLHTLLELLPADAIAERVKVAEALSDLEGLWTANPVEARRVLDAERPRVTASGDPRARAELSLAMAYERTHNGDHIAAEALALEALSFAREAGDAVLEAAAAVRLADASHCTSRTDDPERLAVVEERFRSARRMVDALSDGEAATRLQMVFWLSAGLYFTGALADSFEVWERGLAIAQATRQDLLTVSFKATISMFYLEQLDLKATAAAADEGLEALIVTGNRAVGFWSSLCASRVALYRGDVDTALLYGEQAWELLRERPASAAGSTVADARLAAGDVQGAIAALDAFGWVNPGLWTLDRVRAAEVGVRVLIAAERVDEAAELAARVPAEAGGRRDGVFGAVAAAAEARVLMARGEDARAASVAGAGALAGTPLWSVRCRLVQGEALAACGRGNEARAVLRPLVDEVTERGAFGFRDAAVHVLRRLGDRPRPAVAASADGEGPFAALTPREREVAQLVGVGSTNAQIALRLHLSERTVEKHVSSVLGKLGVGSRAGVVRLVAEEGAPSHHV